MMILPTLRGVMKRSSQAFVGAAVQTNPSGTMLIPDGAVVGDMLLFFTTYAGSYDEVTSEYFPPTVSGVTFAGSTYMTDVYGYTGWVMWKKLVAGDFTAPKNLTSVYYGPVLTAAYRGVNSVNGLGASESNTTSLDSTIPGKSVNSMGWVSFVSDRSGAGDASPPSGWTKRTGPNATGIFTASLADRLDVPAMPSTSTTVSWTFPSDPYYQKGFFLELLA